MSSARASALLCCVAAPLLLGACERGVWVPGGVSLPYCLLEAEAAQMDPAKLAATRHGMELVALHVCDASGRKFAGEMRCRDGHAEVHCR